MDFLANYFFLLILALVGLAVFWGLVAWAFIAFFKSKSTGLTTQQKMDVAASIMGAASGRGSGGSGGLMDTQAGSAAADAGIDLDRP